MTYWCSLRAHTACPYLLHELCRRRFCLSLTWYTPHAHTFPASTRFAPNILGIRASVPKTFQMTVIFKPDMRCRAASSCWPRSAAHHFAERRFRFPAPPPSAYRPVSPSTPCTALGPLRAALRGTSGHLPTCHSRGAVGSGRGGDIIGLSPRDRHGAETPGTSAATPPTVRQRPPLPSSPLTAHRMSALLSSH